MAERPLKPEHCDDLDCILKSCAQTRELLSRCQQCGIDVSKANDENEGQYDLAARLKAAFFPERR